MQPKRSDLIQQKTVTKLIRRLLPKHSQWFRIIVDRKFRSEKDFLDKFKIEDMRDGIQITGTTGVAAANGFHYYLKYYANCSISWSGDHCELDENQKPPKIGDVITKIIKEKFRYYLNACTASYSMVWWQWPRWQREIDWMALNGINLPLAFNGQEEIYRRTFLHFNLTMQEIDDYFTGPAYLAWNRMGNIQSWSGPLSENWHRNQHQLQLKILDRMRNFGMYPVLPGFSGHVPRSFRQKFPEAKINKLANWNHFGSNYSETDFLEPEDPLFVQIGNKFIEEYIDLFDTDHFYSIDLFVEETPSSNESSYLRKCSLGVYESIRNADPDGIWLLQGYPFNSLYDKFWGYNQVEAFVTAPPIDKLLILDNIAEVLPVYSQVNGYFGRSFVWCILQNYGGVNGMFGPINRINEGFFSARKNYPNMIGIGIGPEGINQNDLVFDYVMELVWYDDAPNVSYWFENYPLRRYGINDHRINQALQLLHQSVYNDPIGIKNHGRYSFISRPRPNSHSMLWYDPHLISLALRSLNDYLLINPEIIDRTPTFTHDLIDITLQALQLVFDHHYKLLDRSFREKNLQSMIVSIKNLNDTLDLCESVLQSCENCLLHHWIQDARLLGANQFEQDFNEWQARTQLSIWGPNSNIANYAAKQWSGMFRYLYQPRWNLYFEEILDCIRTNRTHNEREFRTRLFNEIELPFTQTKKQKLQAKANS
ncbi:mRNA splicing factor [Sarcoptes scabiei]|nr:mRNA splicing factor [Sarcoptes scabiei]